MSRSEDSRSVDGVRITALAKIVERNQIWSRMAAKYGVENPLPPWKSSLAGICDALDRNVCSTAILSSIDRRNEEDKLSATVYANLPYPESQLVSLAHSLVVHGVIDEAELDERIVTIRSRLL